MSFENYSQFPNSGQQDSVPGQAPAQDGSAPGQATEQAGTQPMAFPSSESNPASAGQGGEQKTTLWYDRWSQILNLVSRLTKSRMGELEPWVDENFIRNLWFQMGEQVSVKMIRDKFSGYYLSLIIVMSSY